MNCRACRTREFKICFTRNCNKPIVDIHAYCEFCINQMSNGEYKDHLTCWKDTWKLGNIRCKKCDNMVD